MANFKTANFNPITENLRTTLQQKMGSWGVALVIASILLLLTLLVRIRVPNPPYESKAVLELPIEMVPPEVQKEIEKAYMGEEGAAGHSENDKNNGAGKEAGGGIGDHIEDKSDNPNLPQTEPPTSKAGTLGAALKNANKNAGDKTKGGGGGGGTEDGTGWGKKGSGAGGGGTSPIPGTPKAKKATAAGYAFTCNTSSLKNAPRGTYNIEVEVDCNMRTTYIGDRGGTAQDDPAAGKSRAKTITAFLNCATITKTSAALCPQRVIVTFNVDY